MSTEHQEWIAAVNASLDEGIASLRRDIAAFPPDHNPQKTLWDFGQTMAELAHEDPAKMGLTCAAAFYLLATAQTEAGDAVVMVRKPDGTIVFGIDPATPTGEPATEPSGWWETPQTAFTYYLSLPFEQQTALAFVIDWQRRETIRTAHALRKEFEAQYAAGRTEDTSWRSGLQERSAISDGSTE